MNKKLHANKNLIRRDNLFQTSLNNYNISLLNFSSGPNLGEYVCYHFCRLTGLERSRYEEALFEEGCEYAENYSKKLIPSAWEEVSLEMIKLQSYWEWWNDLWSPHISQLFKIGGIRENSPEISKSDSGFLIQNYQKMKNHPYFHSATPSFEVLKALSDKIHKNEKLYQLLPLPHLSTTGRTTDKEDKPS